MRPRGFTDRPVCLLALVLVFGAVPAPAFAGYVHIDATPATGPAPLTVHVYAVAEPDESRPYFVCVHLEYGDGQRADQCDCTYCGGYNDGSNDVDKVIARAEIGGDHDYPCPGIYHLRAWTDPSYCAACDTVYQTVTVGQPTVPIPPLYAIYSNDGMTCQVVAQGTLSVSLFASSTIDWGDGSPVEPFAWTSVVSGFETPTHDYTQNGDFEVRIVDSWDNAACPRSWPLGMAVEIPGNQTHVQVATWGYVKTLYR